MKDTNKKKKMKNYYKSRTMQIHFKSRYVKQKLQGFFFFVKFFIIFVVVN